MTKDKKNEAMVARQIAQPATNERRRIRTLLNALLAHKAGVWFSRSEVQKLIDQATLKAPCR